MESAALPAVAASAINQSSHHVHGHVFICCSAVWHSLCTGVHLGYAPTSDSLGSTPCLLSDARNPSQSPAAGLSAGHVWPIVSTQRFASKHTAELLAVCRRVAACRLMCIILIGARWAQMLGLLQLMRCTANRIPVTQHHSLPLQVYTASVYASPAEGLSHHEPAQTHSLRSLSRCPTCTPHAAVSSPSCRSASGPAGS